MYAVGQANFNDITLGTNSELGQSNYTARAGFDLATGWGTPTLSLIAALACPTSCGGTTCVDLATDPSNCGACGNSCGVGGFCVGGTCGAVTVGLMATTFEGMPGMEFCIVGVGFDPGATVTVTFSETPVSVPSKTGVVDSNGEWAYWDLVPFDTTCTAQQTSGQFTLMEQSSNQPTPLSQSLPAIYFCGIGPPSYGPPFMGNECTAPDGTGGTLFGE